MSTSIWFVTPEATPLAKTGGLADVCGSLPPVLRELGHDVHLFMPWYEWIDATVTDSFVIRLGDERRKIALGLTRLNSISVHLIGHPPFYFRDHLYGPNGGNYPDNDRRFILFCRAVIDCIDRLDPPDVIHCHDWFSGLVPMYLTHLEGVVPVPSVLTIHNLQHQGIFPADSFRYTGLSWSHFHWEEIEYFGQMNMLKAGLTHADRITTVSPTYSQEIQTEPYGEGLHRVLQNRSDDLQGILNGIDTTTWNPRSDDHLEDDEHFDADDREGKSRVRSRLLSHFDLAEGASGPLIGMIGRIVPQKGFQLLVEAWKPLLQEAGSWLILGTGDPQLQQRLKELESDHPNRIRVVLEFNESLAHRIEAGSDLFCMPSRFEPCGLNQMYSMQYGTIPVVHRTGGLADTVHDPKNDPDKPPTGFWFDEFTPGALAETMARAIQTFENDRELWRELQRNGMARDWSWKSSAREYAKLYSELV